MKSLYISQQGCYVCANKENLIVKRKQQILQEIQIPLIEQILVFGNSQVTTQAIKACIRQDIPIVYLSRMGYCYGRVLPLARGYRQLTRYQHQLSFAERLSVAREIVIGKLKNSRVWLQRQQGKRESATIAQTILNLEYLISKAGRVENLQQLIGCEGAAAANYFSAYGETITNSDFVFVARRRRPLETQLMRC